MKLHFNSWFKNPKTEITQKLLSCRIWLFDEFWSVLNYPLTEIYKTSITDATKIFVSVANMTPLNMNQFWILIRSYFSNSSEKTNITKSNTLFCYFTYLLSIQMNRKPGNLFQTHLLTRLRLKLILTYSVHVIY